MRLLFYLTRYPGWGGIESVTSIIVDALIKLGYHIDIISHIQQSEAQQIPVGVNLWQFPDKESHDSEENYQYLKTIVEKGKYDKIIYQDSYDKTENLIVQVSKITHVPFIIFEHNSPLILDKVRFVGGWDVKGIIKRCFYPIFRRKYIKRERMRKKLLYDNCEKYVMLSKRYIPEIKQKLGVKGENKFTYVNNPIIASFLESAHKKYNEIIYVGRLVEEKNVSKILRIWVKMNNLYPHYRLVIVGDGPEKEKLQYLTKKLKLKNINFEGYKNPKEYYQRAKFLLMTSKYEGWPMTLLESMENGCVPIVEANFSAIYDIIEDGVNGYILSAHASVNKWVNLLKNILDNEEFTSLSEASKTKVKEFGVEVIIREWEKLLQNN